MMPPYELLNKIGIESSRVTARCADATIKSLRILMGSMFIFGFVIAVKGIHRVQGFAASRWPLLLLCLWVQINREPYALRGVRAVRRGEAGK